MTPKQKDLLRILKTVRDKFLNGQVPPEDTRLGICYQTIETGDWIAERDMAFARRNENADYMQQMMGIWPRWPEFSGYDLYPVRVPESDMEDFDPRDTLEYYQNHRHVMWDHDHPYGAARWRLLEWMIAELEKLETEEEEEVE